MRRIRWVAVRGVLLLSVVVVAPVASAQTARPAPRRSAAAARKTEAANIVCPAVLGAGLTTKKTYCDVLTGRDPASGIVVTLPPHQGPVTLTFELHNRHTYSEELVKQNRSYRRYTATIGVLTADNTLISRAAVQTEVRTEKELVERIGGGAGPGGIKAVAPTGTEGVRIVIPADEDSVSILGEKLTVLRVDGVDTFSAPGRPIALISDVQVDYQPAVPGRRRPAPKKKP